MPSTSNKAIWGLGGLLAVASLLALLTSRNKDSHSHIQAFYPPTVAAKHGEEPLGLNRENLTGSEKEKENRTAPNTGGRTVIVSDLHSSELIAGAKVFWGFGGHEEFQGATNEVGEFSLSPAGGGYLLVQAADFSPLRTWISENEGETIHISLESGSAIYGKIVSSTPGIDLSEYSVFAWDSRCPPSRSEWLEWFKGNPTQILVSKSDSTGFFRLDGLDPATSFSLMAGGMGEISIPGLFDIEPQGQTVEIEVEPIYGCRVQVFTPDGMGLDSTPSTMANYYSLSQEAVPGEVLSAGDPRLLIAGIDGPMLDWSSALLSPYIFMLASSDFPDEPPGPIECRFDVLGFERLSTRVELSPISSGIRLYSISLEPSFVNQSQIEFVFEHSQAVYDVRPSTSGPVGYLLLNSSDGWQFEYEVSSFDNSFLISGVPYGEYSFQLRLLSRFPSHLGQKKQYSGKLNLGQAEHSATIDISDLGGIEIQFVNPDGSTFYGPVDLSLASIASGAVYPYTFSRAPYLISGLPSDTYRLECRSRDPGGEVIQLTSSSIEVAGQRTTAVQVPLLRPKVSLF